MVEARGVAIAQSVSYGTKLKPQHAYTTKIISLNFLNFATRKKVCNTIKQKTVYISFHYYFFSF